MAFEKQALYSTKKSESVRVIVKSAKANPKGTLRLSVPKSWQVSPLEQTFAITQKGGEASFLFEVRPSEGGAGAAISAEAMVDGQKCDRSLTELKYSHIPTQSVLLPAQLKFTPLQVSCTTKEVGYIMGAGDAVPASLEQLGVNVHLLKGGDLQSAI